MRNTEATDLGNDWFAIWGASDGGFGRADTLTIYNAISHEVIALPEASVARLRDIFRAAAL